MTRKGLIRRKTNQPTNPLNEFITIQPICPQDKRQNTIVSIKCIKANL